MGNNNIIEGTIRTVLVPMQAVDRFKQHGYQVEAHVLAVPFAVSQQGIYSRYEHAKELGGAGRFSPLAVHLEVYTGILTTVDQLWGKNSVDRVVIYFAER